MRRVAVVGMGIHSCLGSSLEQVAESLRAGRCGIEVSEQRREMGFHSPLVGRLPEMPEVKIPKRNANQMGLAARMTVPVVYQALEAARLDSSELGDGRTGILIGNSGAMHEVYENCNAFHERTRRLGGTALQRTLNSSVSANLSVLLQTRGLCMTVNMACASGGAAIGLGFQSIRFGMQDRMICGGIQEDSWEYDCNLDALRAFSKREDEPKKSSRPFDRDRDGLVPSPGCGIVVLEEYEAAVRRGAPIVGEVLGYGATSDGNDMVAPSGEGARRCMQEALASAELQPDDVDYVNAHATGTKLGDVLEAKAIAAVFGDRPLVSSTKSMTGHELGAAGSNEFVLTMLMMKEGFIAPSVNLDNVDDECRAINIAPARVTEAVTRVAVSNSFGFGGVNASLVLGRGEVSDAA